MNIKTNIFGKTKNEETVVNFLLTNKNGMKVNILNYGCTIQKIIVNDVDICLGYNNINEYEKGTLYFGAVIGRYTNRIGNGEFLINDKIYKLEKNNGQNHLHGGLKGFDKHIWNYIIKDDKLQLYRLSKDMEEGYPGNLYVSVTYKLTDENELVIIYNGKSDKETVVNLTNHCYFNLSGHNMGSIVDDHLMQIFSDEFLENNLNCLPTGKILSVKNTAFDFNKIKKIGKEIDNKFNQQIKIGKGYDHNFILSDKNYLKKAAYTISEKTGISMTTYTTQPGLQFYTGNYIKNEKGKDVLYNYRGGFCLETQKYPDSPNNLTFPKTNLLPDEVYNEITIYKFN